MEIVVFRTNRCWHASIDGFTVNGIGLAPHGVRNSGGCHEIPFIGGVHEHLATECPAGKRSDRYDCAITLLHTLLPIQPFSAADVQAISFFPSFKNLQCGGWFESPHGTGITRTGALPIREIRLGLLMNPVIRIGVVFRNIAVEFDSYATERRLHTDIGLAEPASRQSADTRFRRYNHNALAHTLRLNRS